MERRGWWLKYGKNNFFWVSNSYYCIRLVSRSYCYNGGFKAKEANRAEKEEVNEEGDLNSSDKINTLSEELEKLNNLRESGVITQEEFEKAKKKLLDN